MTQGESSREETCFGILRFLFENGEFRGFKDIEKNCNGARNTVKKYLDELKDEELVEQSLDGRHPYRITEKGKKHFEKLMIGDDIYDLTRSFDAKWLEILRRLLRNMRKHGTDPSEYFQRSCIAFVGGLPYTFGKSKEEFQVNVLDFESRLERNGRKEGLTKEEYWRKKLKEAENLKGAHKILTIRGYTEEEIEEMRIRQGGTFKVTLYTRKKS